ncbi:MAG: DUF502 domain-containing protein [Bacteroidota bacterium]|nr:DUF502 domain-containing protein [Bacteroidota bacterium]
MKKIAGYFLQGILYTAPIGLTIYLFYITFEFLDNLLPFNIPGLGIVIILAGITLIGFVGQWIISQPIISLFQGMIEKMPLVKVIYSSIKDLLSAFVGKERKFRSPVLVKISADADIERMGFITQESLSEFGIKNKIAVYIPSSYGLLGDLFIVPSENVTPINIHPTEAMKFIVSGGVSKE